MKRCQEAVGHQPKGHKPATRTTDTPGTRVSCAWRNGSPPGTVVRSVKKYRDPLCREQASAFPFPRPLPRHVTFSFLTPKLHAPFLYPITLKKNF